MPTKIEPKIITNALEYKNELMREAILEYTDRLKNHLIAGDRNYLQYDLDWLIVRLHEIDNADFERGDIDEKAPF